MKVLQRQACEVGSPDPLGLGRMSPECQIHKKVVQDAEEQSKDFLEQ